jgi:hypothetical protein
LIADFNFNPHFRHLLKPKSLVWDLHVRKRDLIDYRKKDHVEISDHQYVDLLLACRRFIHCNSDNQL